MPTISETFAIALQNHQAGRLQAADQIYRQILAADPNHADALHLLGVIASQSGQHEVAAKYIRRAIALKGTEATFHSNLGAVLKARGEFDEAVVCCRRALELKPDSAAAHFNLGAALQEQGKLDEAIGCFRRAVEIKPDYVEAHHNLGNAFLADGKLDEAIACCRRTLALSPNYALAHYNVGVALLAQANPNQAMASLKRAIELKPELSEGYFRLGQALQSLGKLDEAVESYDRAGEVNPNLAEAYRNLGRALQAQGKLDRAAACFLRVVQLKPGIAEAHNDLGNAFLFQGKLEQALICYRAALALKPDFAEAHGNLAIMFRGQGKLDEAIACCRRALESNPSYVLAHATLGDSLLAEGKLDEAIASYRRAFELEPHAAEAHGTRDNALRRSGGFDETLTTYLKAEELNEDFPYAVRFLSSRDHSLHAPAGAEIGGANDEEHRCQFVSSRGILKSCDVRPRRPVSSIRAFPYAEYPPDWMANLRRGDSVYVCTSAVPDFIANVFSRLPPSCPSFVLVTGDADELAPVDLFPTSRAAHQFLESPRILAWFAQNCVMRHPKLVPIPIGLDYQTLVAGNIPWWGPRQTPSQQEAELQALRTARITALSPHRAYANFQFSMFKRFGNERRAAIAQISPQCVYYEPHNTTRLESWQRQRFHHRFVLSPAGHGLDCHRTWEALCLGCIPIVRSSPLDVLWEGLPVWVVNSWSEVTEEAMERKAEEFDNSEQSDSGTIPEKLLLKTWVDKIRQAGVTSI